MINDTFQNKQIIIKGQLLNYYHKDGFLSSGPTLLFLHGWGGDANTWSSVVDSFSDKVSNIVMVDLPGFGKSENPKTPFDIEDYTSVIHSFIKQVTEKSVIVIGHSFGGRIAGRLASDYNDDVEKIVLVNSAGIRISESRSRFFEIIAKILKLFIPDKVKTKLYDFLDSDYSLRPDLKATFKKIMTNDIDIYKNINIPTLIIWGDKDDVTPLQSGEKMHSLIKNSEFFVIKGAGHMSFVEQPKIFIDKITKFIS